MGVGTATFAAIGTLPDSGWRTNSGKSAAMIDEHWRAAWSVYESACELPAGEACVRRVGISDPELRRRVMALLDRQSHEHMRRMLTNPTDRTRQRRNRTMRVRD